MYKRPSLVKKKSFPADGWGNGVVRRIAPTRKSGFATEELGEGKRMIPSPIPGGRDSLETQDYPEKGAGSGHKYMNPAPLSSQGVRRRRMGLATR
jgi:hypothetical protein